MGDTFANLEAEYCPPLDAALLSAILSDYDLNNEDNVREARVTLDELKESALVEEQLGFDPAGTGAVHDTGRPESCPDTSVSASRETDLTSLSNGLGSLDFDIPLDEEFTAVGNSDIAEELESLDEERKIQLLEQIFGKRVSHYKIQHTLRKCDGKWHRAFEELQNHVFLDEAQDSDDGRKLPNKSIDAFSEDNNVPRGRKGKAKKKNLLHLDDRRSSSVPLSPTCEGSPSANAWQSSSKDIEFIAERTGMTSKNVSSLYYSCNASVPKTIGAILKSNLAKGVAAVADDPIMAVNAHDLKIEYPGVASDYMDTLVSLTCPSTAAAHELAKALTQKPSSAGGIQIIPQYARPGKNGLLSEDDNAGTSTRITEDYASAGNASVYAAARSAALAQAYAAHRRAKSDRLMGGAAAYYGEEARTLAALSSRASAAAANQLAASQSSSNQLDLHGIDVLNAVRIAEQKVLEWWESTAEDRASGRSRAGAGYRIVVGRGTHSEGGKGKLGPAVSKMLKTNGWKFEVGGAVIVVKGRARL